MNVTSANPERIDPGWTAVGMWSAVGIGAFHLAQSTDGLGWPILLFAVALLEISRQPTKRRAFYPALFIGLAAYAPQLAFFRGIFGVGAIALWLVLSFWIAVFSLLVHLARQRFGELIALALAPVLWTGLEYFRGELYFLRFTWLTLGMAFGGLPILAKGFGWYGLGFLVMAIAASAQLLRPRHLLGRALVPVAIALGATVAKFWIGRPRFGPPGSLPVAGVQLEFQSESRILRSLDQLIARFPDAKLVMLSEYTFDGPVPDSVRSWCRTHSRYLVAGGKEPVGQTNFYNTAYVIGPDGEICHRQGKSVPIQFFRDGLPALERQVWRSPWGPLGILICYDLNYTRVTDDFIRQGAKALLAPTMDVADWGRHEHELHARITPLRAAEYGVPIFRVCSSGISQLVTADGAVTAWAPFPGEGAMLGGHLQLVDNARIPWDRSLARAAVAGTALVVVALIWTPVRKRNSKIAGLKPPARSQNLSSAPS